MNTTRVQHFEARYNRLNPQQKKAVDTIDGPLMIVAGPGTGKTEVLGARIANILRRTDARPEEILCLTFTNTAVRAMRERLRSFLGTEAYKVNIYTFHGFCQELIMQEGEIFGEKGQPLDDLERLEIIDGILSGLKPTHPLFSTRDTGMARRLKSFFEDMKQEGLTEETMGAAIDEYIDSLPERPEMQYKRANAKKGIQVGDPKTAQIEKEKEKMKRTRAAAELLTVYQQKLDEMGRYEMADMLRWVTEAWQAHPDFLLRCQEQYQYVLVDEYQDTNNVQNELLLRLVSYWEEPNVCVVGDDDQSIFRFQGANVENLLTFGEQYKDSVTWVTLTTNYRSGQPILDAATRLIGNNTERLSVHVSTIEKSLRAGNVARSAERTKVQVVRVLNEEAQAQAVVEEIKQSLDAGVAGEAIAVLYKTHAEGERVRRHLEGAGVAYTYRRPTNVFDEPVVRQFLKLFAWVEAETAAPGSGDGELFLLLHAPWWGLTAADIAKLTLERNARMRALRQQEGEVTTEQSWGAMYRGLLEEAEEGGGLARVSAVLEQALMEARQRTVASFFEWILVEGGVLLWAMKQEDQGWYMRVFQTLHSHVQALGERMQNLALSQWKEALERMEAQQVRLPAEKLYGGHGGVELMTVYASKGEEFDTVHVLGAYAKRWEKERGRGGGFAFPDTLFLHHKHTNEEEQRRLFFVALTRAERELKLWVPEEDMGGRVLEPSRFVAEMKVGEAEVVPESEMFVPSVVLVPPVKANAPLGWLSKEEVASRLEHFTWSATAFNTYLRCPLAFYFQHILRVPQGGSGALGFGKAVHDTLETVLRHWGKTGKVMDQQGIEKRFMAAMGTHHVLFTEEEREKYTAHGLAQVPAFVGYYGPTWKGQVLVEQRLTAQVGPISLTGRLDAVFVHEGKLQVVDFKTGNPDKARFAVRGPTDRSPVGGDYWRQMGVYRLLVEGTPRFRGRWGEGVVQSLEPMGDEHVPLRVDVGENELGLLKEQLMQIYEDVHAQRFRPGCGKVDGAYPCRWCQLVEGVEGLG